MRFHRRLPLKLYAKGSGIFQQIVLRLLLAIGRAFRLYEQRRKHDCRGVTKTLEQVEAEVRKLKYLLESLVLVDEYAGKNIESGYRSLAWRLTFRHPTRTLSAKEMEGRRTNVLRHLEKTLNVRARTT